LLSGERVLELIRWFWVQVPLHVIHTDEEYWGKDAKEWKPERFKDGVTKACKHPLGYMPFGLGPRICIGQNFAMTEVKVTLGTMIRRYSWTLSPDFRDGYSYAVALKPGGPVPIILTQRRKSN
jgi:cytochrome P450